jgi:hypothetical protein
MGGKLRQDRKQTILVGLGHRHGGLFLGDKIFEVSITTALKIT